MPVRYSSSSVIVWPKPDQVEQALHIWTEKQKDEHASLVAVGYFGSYARGDWGVGSDLDVVVVVDRSETPKDRRTLEWDTCGLPVPVDLFVFTREEWKDLVRRDTRFARTVRAETRWILREDI